MEFLGPYMWLLVLVLGVVALGGAIAWGMRRTAHRTLAEQARTEAATRREYADEDAERPD
jgi:hypothetical protein